MFDNVIDDNNDKWKVHEVVFGFGLNGGKLSLGILLVTQLNNNETFWKDVWLIEKFIKLSFAGYQIRRGKWMLDMLRVS